MRYLGESSTAPQRWLQKGQERPQMVRNFGPSFVLDCGWGLCCAPFYYDHQYYWVETEDREEWAYGRFDGAESLNDLWYCDSHNWTCSCEREEREWEYHGAGILRSSRYNPVFYPRIPLRTKLVQWSYEVYEGMFASLMHVFGYGRAAGGGNMRWWQESKPLFDGVDSLASGKPREFGTYIYDNTFWPTFYLRPKSSTNSLALSLDRGVAYYDENSCVRFKNSILNTPSQSVPIIVGKYPEWDLNDEKIASLGAFYALIKEDASLWPDDAPLTYNRAREITCVSWAYIPQTGSTAQDDYAEVTVDFPFRGRQTAMMVVCPSIPNIQTMHRWNFAWTNQTHGPCGEGHDIGLQYATFESGFGGQPGDTEEGDHRAPEPPWYDSWWGWGPETTVNGQLFEHLDPSLAPGVWAPLAYIDGERFCQRNQGRSGYAFYVTNILANQPAWGL